MFVIEVVMGGGGILECNILKSVPNILSPLMYVNGLDKGIRNTQLNIMHSSTPPPSTMTSIIHIT